MDSLEKIKAIVAHIQAIDPHTTIVTPGLSKTEILDAFETLEFNPPAILIELYQWCNGFTFFDDYRILSLSEAVVHHRRITKSLEAFNNTKRSGSYFHGDYWFPIVCCYPSWDDYYIIDIENLSLHTASFEGRLFEKHASHFDKYLDALLYMFENKFYTYFEQSKDLYVDEDKCTEVIKKYRLINFDPL